MSADSPAAPDLSLNVRYTRKVQENREEEEEEQVEISEDEEHHADLRSHEANPHTHNNPVAVKRRCFSAATVTLGVMYLLIIAGLCTRYISVTLEKDKLKTRYDQLNNSYSHLQELMSIDYSQLQSSYKILRENHSQLQEEVKQLRDKIEGKWCPDGWRRFGCSCYFKSDEKESWERSRGYCRQRGADLVVINSKEEQKFVTELSVDGESWIGLKQRDSDYKWEWVDTSPLTDIFWEPGLPKSYTYRMAATCCNQQGQWRQDDYYNYNNKKKKNWICEK